jgi:FkbM family methyltransferase
MFEWYSSQGRQIIERTDKWILTEVFGSFEMYVMNGDSSITPHLVGEGFWESWISSWVTKNVDSNTRFYDIGANSGYYTWLALEQGAVAVAFEPNPAYFEMMQATAKHNNIKSKLLMYKCALSDEDDVATLWVPQHLHGSASINQIDDRYKPTPVEVTTRRLDSLMLTPTRWGQDNNNVIVKIDAEGAEEKIWDGFGKLLEAPDAPVFMIEYTNGSYSDEFITKLQNYGTIYTIDHEGNEALVDRHWLESQNDWVMIVVRKH